MNSATSREVSRRTRLLAGVVSLGMVAVGLLGFGAAAQAAGPEREYTSKADPTATYLMAEVFDVGEELVIKGTNWTTTAGDRGSIIGVMVDAKESGDPNTIYTRRDVINPMTGTVHTDKRLHAIVRADLQGNWTARVPMPTPANAYLGEQSGNPAIPAWAAGQRHSIRLLTGSLGASIGDKIRSDAAEFCLGTCSEDPEEPEEPEEPEPEEPGGTCVASVSTATADVVSTSTEFGGTLRVQGTGWCHPGRTAALR